MKTTKLLIILVLALDLMSFMASSAEATPMGTAFTYQGRLIDANSVADGLYDFQFKLYDANIAGTQQGSTITVEDLGVIDGYFTVALDFGSDVFNGDARRLQIGVRAGELKDPSPYTVLSPRQEITPTPYALHTDGLSVIGSSTFVGKDAGANNSNPMYDNTFSGYQAGYSNTTGYRNSAVGAYALWSNTKGNYNSSMGYHALYGNTTGFSNSAVGSYALCSNTTGEWNSAVGSNALRSNTTGKWNSAVGTLTLYYNTTGNENSAMGLQALYNNTTGNENSAMGTGALYKNIIGGKNLAVGSKALYSNTTGNENSAMGSYALFSNRAGNYNSAVGYRAGYNATGNGNVFLGYQAGLHNATGSGNVFLGYQAGYSWGTVSNILCIANSDANNLIIGDFSAQKIGIATGPTETLDVGGTLRVRTLPSGSGTTVVADGNGKLWKASSSQRYKADIRNLDADTDAVLKLRPVRFQWKTTGQNDIGLIAEEVEQQLSDLVIYDNEARPDAVKYDRVSLYLLAVVKDLKAENESLMKANEEIKNRLAAIESLVTKLSLQLEGGIK